MKEAEWWDKRRRFLLAKHGETVGSARYDKEVEDGRIREGVDIDREIDASDSTFIAPPVETEAHPSRGIRGFSPGVEKEKRKRKKKKG